VNQKIDRRNRGRRITDLATHSASFITIPALGAYLEVQPRTVRKWIDAGVLQAYRFPPFIGEWRINLRDAIEFVKRSRVTVDRDA
jgi:hypothetical protein